MIEYIKLFRSVIHSLNSLQKWRFISIIAVIAYCFSIWVLPNAVEVFVSTNI